MNYSLNDVIKLRELENDVHLVSPIYKILSRLSLGDKKGTIINIENTNGIELCYQVKFDSLIIELQEEIIYFIKIN